MELDAHQRRRAEHERDLEAWRDAPRKGRSERPPAPPPARRLVVSDVTVEALALRLSESPGGLLVNRDELAGWVRSFDRYRGGRGGDAQAWLEMHRAGSIIVDRRSGEVLSVRRAAVSIIGGVQPEVLAAALAGEHVANGLAARILYAMPPTTPARWTDAEVGDDLRTDWATLLDELRDLRYEMDAVDEHRPVALPLTADAREMYRRWHDWRAERMADAESDALAAAGAKVQGYAARLALLRQLADDANAGAVGVEAMTAGIEMADWFANEAARVYSTMTERPEDHERRRLVDWIIGKGGGATERELSRGPRQYRGPGAATVALDNLVCAGVGQWLEVPAGPDGGRPTRRFVLRGGDEIRGGDGDETPKHGAGDETRRNPNVAGVDGGDTTTRGRGGSVAVAGGEHAKTDDEGQLDLDDEGPMPWGGMNL